MAPETMRISPSGNSRLQVVGKGLEEDQRHGARLVKDFDTIRNVGTASRGWFVGPDRDFDRHNTLFRQLIDFATVSAVHQSRRQMQDEIHQLDTIGLADEAAEQRFNLFAHALEAGDGGKEWGEQIRPHGGAVVYRNGLRRKGRQL